MGWFNLILEDVLNEVDARTARAKFYNMLSDEDFNIVAQGKTNLDKVDQFFLNAIRDKTTASVSVGRIIKILNNTDPKIRDIVRTKIMNNDFLVPEEVFLTIRCLENTGRITNKGWTEKGLVVLGRNEDWTATVTTNYTSNSHYFGYTQWCTASDRNGRHDGYEMFERYSIYNKAILVQFVNNSNKQESYQIECRTYGPFGDCKDIEDESVDPRALARLVGQDLFNEATSMENREKYFEITEKQMSDEEEYQKFQGNIIRVRKNYLREIHEKEARKIKDKVKEFNEKQQNYISAMAEKAKANDVFHDINFISKLLDIRLHDGIRDNEQAKEVYYLAAGNVNVYNRSKYGRIAIIPIGLIEGPSKTTSRDYDVEGYEDDGKVVVEDYFNNSIRECISDPIAVACYVIASVNVNNDLEKIIYVSEMTKGCPTLMEMYETLPGQNMSLTISHDSRGNVPYVLLSAYNGKSGILSLNSFDFVEIEENDYLRGFVHPENAYYDFIFNLYADNNHYVQFDHNSGKFIKKGKGMILHNRDEGNYITYKFRLNSGIIFPVNKVIMGKPFPPEFQDVDNIYFERDEKHTYIVYTKDEGSYIAPIEDMSHIIFTRPCSSFITYSDNTSTEYDNSVIGFPSDSNDRVLVYYYETNEYYIVTHNKQIPSNSNGETREEMIASKNFRDWQAQGGHSPEAKAQMDKMWADRNGPSHQEILNNIWNDDDTARDRRSYYQAWGDDMKNFKADPKWNGALGIKDPYFNPSDPNSFYRIGGNGKALDQQWNDEDEVPANLSNEPIHESVKKIHNILDRINKL